MTLCSPLLTYCWDADHAPADWTRRSVHERLTASRF